jgi:signal transduction histidine kinase
MEIRSKPVEVGRRVTLHATSEKEDAGSVATPLARSGLFRKYVAMFSAVVGLALIINSVSDFWFSYQEQKALLVRIQHGQAQSAAQKIEQFLNEITAGLAWQTQLTWSVSTLHQWQFDAVRLFRQVPALTEIMRLDAMGQEQFRMSREAPDVVMSGVDHSNDASFIQAIAGKVYYGPVHFINESQPTMMIAMAGVRPEFGIIVGRVNLTFIWDVVSQIRVGKHGQAYVVDAAGRLIAHPDISLVLRKTEMARLTQVRDALASGSDGAAIQPLEGVDIKGRQVLSAYAGVVPTGWTVFAELPIVEALAPLYDSALRSAILALVALALAFFAALFLARRMIVPIRALGQGAAQIGSGDLGKRISINTGDELETLGDEFSRMAARLQDSYATLERKVQERTRQLEIANQAKSRFLATASHDLRQPLHALGLFIAQLRGRTKADDRKRIVAGVEAALAGMNELFKALLDISKLDAGAMTPNVTEFPIANLLKRIETTFAGLAREKGLTLRIVDTGAWVISDSILLERVVINLVSNAIRYTSTGHVLIGCRRRGGNLRIEVWDTGPGIPQDQQQNIFGEFYRLGNPHADAGGLGLGLAIVDRLGRLLNHPIGLTSTTGKGACFFITVPMVSVPAQSVKSQTRARPRLLSISSKLVVVIDDDPLVLEGMSGLIRSWGCSVVTGNTDGGVLDGLAKYDNPPNVIISDYHLRNGKNGIEVIARLREALSAPIPAFLMSGDTNTDPLREAQRNGYALLHKPVDPAVLRLVLTQALKIPSLHAY